MRIITLNLNGVRSAASKGFFAWLTHQQADVVCVQDLKAQKAEIPTEVRELEGLQGYFHCALKKGYSGVGLYARREPDLDDLGWVDVFRRLNPDAEQYTW